MKRNRQLIRRPLQRHGHEVVEARLHGRRGAFHGKEIGLHVALKAPIVPQHLGKQPRVFAGLKAVQIVVGAHEGGHLPILHRHFKGQEIKLPKHGFVHGLGEIKAVRLLFIGGEVLRHRNDAFSLNAPNLGHGLGPREEGVLSEILKISAQHGNAREVHPRRLKNMQRQRLRFLRNDLAEAVGRRGVEGRRDGHGGRQRRGLRRGGVGIGHDARHIRRE